MELPSQVIPEVSYLELRFKDRKTIWNNIELFDKKQKMWMQTNFDSINIDEIEEQVRAFEIQNNSLKLRIN